MSAWWERLSARDRRTLVGGGAFVAIALLVVLVILPLFDARASLRRQVAQAEADVAWMRDAKSQLGAIRNTSSGAGLDRAGRSLLALADMSARDAGLGTALKRVEPVNEGRVNVWLESAPFDSTTTWLETLARTYGVTVDELSVDRAEVTGFVNARVTLLDPPQ